MRRFRERIANEILMYFRGQRKLQNEVSLSDALDADGQEDSLQLLDVVGVEDTILEDLHERDSALRVRQLVRDCLTEREAEIIRLRYGLDGAIPMTQRQVADIFGISRSYVSRIEKKSLLTLRAGLECARPRRNAIS